MSKETIMHLPLPGLPCVRVWISRVHLWIALCVDLSHAFLDCVRECGSFACICGLCPRVWISCVHLWIALWIPRMHLCSVCTSVDLSRAFVGGFDTVFTPYILYLQNAFTGKSASFISPASKSGTYKCQKTRFLAAYQYPWTTGYLVSCKEHYIESSNL